MSAERAESASVKEKHSISADLDTLKFVGLYFIATGKVPRKDRILLLRDFDRLSLEQGSGGFDEMADKVARDDPRHSKIVKTYWGNEQVEKYRNLINRVDEIYTESEARAVKIGMASWYNTFHFQESKIRGVIPPVTDIEAFRSAAADAAVNFREVTNKAYVSAMLEILDPAVTEEKKGENKELVDKVLHPSIMLYQVATDYAQRGLPCQDAKLTMDKNLGTDLDNLSLLKRVGALTRHAWNQGRDYMGQIEFPNRLTNMSLRVKFTQGVAWLSYAQEVLKYQVLHSDKERYPQAVLYK